MTLTSNSIDTLVKTPAIDLFLGDPQTIPELEQLDEKIISALWEMNKETRGYYSEETKSIFANEELALLAQETYDTESSVYLEDFLNEKGTIKIPLLDGFLVMVNGIPRAVSIVTATELSSEAPNRSDMTSMLYLRDQVQAASVLMDLYLRDPLKYEDEAADARTLLFSALHLMSTSAQLERFNDVIKRGSEAGQADWPHISLLFNDMEALGPNDWRNKQDTFQMLAYTTFDAIERGFIDVNELDNAHKQFLGSVVPLLEAVGFPKYENSGSWEEVEAHRTSVMAIETALLHKMKTMRENGTDLGFLEDGYNSVHTDNFDDTLRTMLDEGLQELGRRLPYESPNHENEPIKFREADAALAYVLMYDIPDLLADTKTPVGPEKEVLSRRQVEDLVLGQLSTLFDPETNGMLRYKDDSYLRNVTNKTHEIIKGIKQQVKKEAEETGREIDLDKKQMLRNELTPKGREAAWTHPLGQLSAWAAGRSLKATEIGNFAEAEEYRVLSTQFLNRMLSTITGENQWHATLDTNNRYGVQRVSPYKLPECYVAYETNTGETFTTPSPHTPLNWSSATAKQAIGLLRMSMPA